MIYSRYMKIDNLIKNKTTLVSQWWIGNNRRRKYTGTLKFDEQMTLDISGSGNIDLNRFKYSKITGITSNDECIILLNNLVSQNNNHTSGDKSGWSMSLQPSDVLYFSKNSCWRTTTLTYLKVCIPYLDFWLDDKLFSTNMNDHIITYTERNERSYQLDDIKLVFSTGLSGLGKWNINTRNTLNLEQNGYLRFEYPKEVDYDKAIKFYRQLEGFFKLAYVNQFFIKTFSGYFMRTKRYSGKSYPCVESKDIYQNKIINRKLRLPSDIIDDLFLFKFRDLDEPENTIKRWLEIEPALTPVYELLFSSLESGIYVEQKFLNLVNACEIFHRRFRNRTRKSENEWELQKTQILNNWHGEDRALIKSWLKYANEITLEERLVDLAGTANNAGFRGVTPEKIRAIANTRNNFIHKEFGRTSENLSLINCNEALIEILLISILQELNFTNEKIHILIRNRWIFRYSNMLVD